MNATYYQTLKELISMQSVSVDADHKDDIEKITIYLNAMLQDNGFISEIIHGYGNPVVVGKFSVDKSLPTMLLYGHYDVQMANIHE
jgi:acetylornithine deacetylase/succinyl-diaminopimelate desuccinylase-like protein